MGAGELIVSACRASGFALYTNAPVTPIEDFRHGDRLAMRSQPTGPLRSLAAWGIRSK
jgi:hypothetical protein